MKFALNMVVIDASQFLKVALQSVLPFCEEAIVVDTGSKDNTMEILLDFQKKYPYLRCQQVDVSHLGEVWTGSQRDAALTQILNDTKAKTTSKWILKIDDDEFYPRSLIEEIKTVREDAGFIYSIPFIHVGYSGERKLAIKRLFRNVPEVNWNGLYGTETLALNGKRISTSSCSHLSNYFIHLGSLRENLDRKHDYEF